MAPTYTALIGKEGDWWIGWIQEVPGVNCQERTREELVDSLKAVLKEYMSEDLAYSSSLSGFEQVPIRL